jgi:hypothetical protein
MKKTVLTFGLISGVIVTIMMWGTIPFMHKIGFNRGMIIGYTTMILSFMMIFFGIRSYRENYGGGTITFGRAFAIGILITLISSAMYVMSWEILYFGLPGFGEKFVTTYTEMIKTSGAPPDKIQAQLDMIKYLDNPLLNVAMTFTEPFPVGLIITLISALVLRKKAGKQADGGPLMAEA